jgi:hypothetical protein
MSEAISFTSYEDMAEEADKYIRELETWLADFSEGRNKRPDHQIANRRRRLAWAEKISELCKRAAEKRGEAA